MKITASATHEPYPDTHHDMYSRTIFGFWIYLMTDFILFGTLFATYVVLSYSAFGGQAGVDLFSLPYSLVQTLIFLMSSLTAGLAGSSAHRRNKQMTVLFFGITFFLGCIFMGMEFNEFSRLVHTGNIWSKNAYMSAYFSVVGTHGVHVLFGLLWILVMLIPVVKEGLTPVSIRRLTCLRMFWQFLNIIWVFIFTLVYLMA